MDYRYITQNILQFTEFCKRFYKYQIDFLDHSFEKSYGFESIAIQQAKNICKSRLDVDITTEFIRDVNINIPLVAANMSTVVNEKFYNDIWTLGGAAIYHRADSNENLINIAKKMKCEWRAFSVGVGENQYILAKNLIDAGANIICVDVAHGYSDAVITMAKKIKHYDPFTKVIVGNTVNPNFLYECDDYIDAVKVGIGQGYACDTATTAGCTEKQFSAILKFKKHATKLGIPIIADGGIRQPSDFTKAIAAGANSVMAGKIFAECSGSAAARVLINDEIKIQYAGMASEYVQNSWKGGVKNGTCAEGGIRYLDENDSPENLMNLYSGALKSGITYAGANDIRSFHDNVKFILL